MELLNCIQNKKGLYTTNCIQCNGEKMNEEEKTETEYIDKDVKLEINNSRNHVIQFKVITTSGIMWLDVKNSKGTVLDIFPVSISILKDAIKEL